MTRDERVALYASLIAQAAYHSARAARDNPPTAAKGRFPYPHRTVAEVDGSC